MLLYRGYRYCVGLGIEKVFLHSRKYQNNSQLLYLIDKGHMQIMEIFQLVGVMTLNRHTVTTIMAESESNIAWLHSRGIGYKKGSDFRRVEVVWLLKNRCTQQTTVLCENYKKTATTNLFHHLKKHSILSSNKNIWIFCHIVNKVITAQMRQSHQLWPYVRK